MASIINDVHLARLAPALFIDASALGTNIISGADGATSGTTFTSASSDFVASMIDAGHVVVIGNDEVVEVDARLDATTLNVTAPRVDDTDNTIAPVSGTNQAFSVLTFERQVAESEAWVLGALGIDPAHPDTPLDVDAIVNRVEVERLVALRTIARLYELAAARDPAQSNLADQAAHWRQAERDHRHRTVTYIDRDQDGVPDTTRRIDVVTFTRA